MRAQGAGSPTAGRPAGASRRGRPAGRTRVLERGADGSAVTLSTLPGGLRVVTESVPGARSVSVGVWVGVGSIDEAPRLSGASHFLEHLLFKGTRYRSGQDISRAIDAVGGELNAFTSHEYTCYYARVLAEEAALAVDLVCEVVLDATITAPDLETERTVILEEIAMRDDDPEETLADAFGAAVFAGHPLAAPVIGTVETVTAATRTQVAGYYRRRYSPDKMVVAVAGRVDHADVLRWVRRAFADRLAGDTAPVGPRRPHGGAAGRRAGDLVLVERDTEQAHLCVGVPSFSRHDPRRYAQAVLSAALGGGMSSRLFRSIREERGLAYSCYSATSAYADVGSFSVYAGCMPENLGQVTKLIGQELQLAADRGIGGDELARAKGQLTGSLVLSLEDPESRMSRIGKNLLVRPDLNPVDAELAALAAVSAADVTAVAADLLRRPFSAALVGPYGAPDDLPPELIDMVG